MLAGYERERRAARARRAPPRGALRALLLGAAAAGIRRDHGLRAPVGRVRRRRRRAARGDPRGHRATTTFGYGPRFLHSTGQFHKGGPRIGRFLQLLHDGPRDVEIPGAPYTFTTLKEAQAIGDLQTLRELGLPAERVRLEGDDPAGALRALTATIKEGT